MKYMGSKARHAKEIIPFLMEHYKEGMWYIEPFVGGANMIDKVPVPNNRKIGCDVNEYLIAMLKAASRGWRPPEIITEEDYKFIREHKDEDKALTGYVGFSFSYAAKWWGGYRRNAAGTKEDPELKRINEELQSWTSFNSCIEQFPLLKGITFIDRDVLTIEDIQGQSIIYADPPYANATSYRDAFDHEKFYDWCRMQHANGHFVYVSEYNMPDDFTCVWSKPVNNSLARDTGSKKGVEKLFTIL